MGIQRHVGRDGFAEREAPALDFALLDSIPGFIALIRADGAVLHISESAAQQLGPSTPAASGRARRWLSLLPAAARIPMSRAMESARNGDTVRSLDVPGLRGPLELRPAGGGRILCVAAQPGSDPDDMRLREIDHRMKNSLATIASLMRIQARAVDEPAARDALKAAGLRVLTIGRVHEQLYRATVAGGADVRLDAYLRPLVEDLVASLSDGHVQLTCDVNDVAVPSSDAIGIGLIVTELVMDSLRHAFAEGTGTGALSVALAQGPAGLRLCVHDNGPGLADRDALCPTQGIGGRIIDLYARTLGATLSSDAPPGGGARFTLDLPR